MATIRREFVFSDDRPFQSCHASTIVPLNDGRIFAAWFGGSHEKNPDTAIWASRRSRDAGWSPPVKVADEDGVPHWNPVAAISPKGDLQLFYKAGPNCSSWHTRVIKSDDNGQSWSTPYEYEPVNSFPVGPVKNKPIILSDGTWIAPTSLETEDSWDSAVTLSQDAGAAWTLGGPVPLNHAEFDGKGVIQPTLWESEPGYVHMMLRSTAGKIYRSDSQDGGNTWRPAYPTDLPNNNSGIDVVRMKSETLALCCNPVSENWGKRSPLVVSFSVNNGTDWTDPLVLEDEDPETQEKNVVLDRAKRPNEFSYPSIITRDDEIVVSYTWKRERVACCFISS